MSACCSCVISVTPRRGVYKPGAMLSLSSYEVLHDGKTLMGSLFGGLKQKTHVPILLKRYMDKIHVGSPPPLSLTQPPPPRSLPFSMGNQVAFIQKLSNLVAIMQHTTAIWLRLSRTWETLNLPLCLSQRTKGQLQPAAAERRRKLFQ
ncbi:hypothetical protein PIB30_061007 [Stylosanthes scabra]|uniref:Uncharacterized protein n=1 Tax=Stylosanthes scabra TaxID=79078 RepID=A0ABU6RL27_9FABA|nr:hypothetical protein [Stylosanthes scabra]